MAITIRKGRREVSARRPFLIGNAEKSLVALHRRGDLGCEVAIVHLDAFTSWKRA